MADPGGGYQVQLPEFEGPLDLLLHLVRRHELDILDIPVAFITERYLEHLELMRALNIDVAGEYLLMAATLAHIKSRELLPRPPEEAEEEGEEEGDPREALVRRLLEYQRYKEAAEALAARPRLGAQTFPRGAPDAGVAPGQPPLKEVGTFALLSALARVLERNRIKMTYDVVMDRISITDRINEIVDRLAAGAASLRFTELLALEEADPRELRRQVVATFLALLEMTRLRMIRVLQSDPDGEIHITAAGGLRPVEADGAADYR